MNIFLNPFLILSVNIEGECKRPNVRLYHRKGNFLW